MEIFEFYFEAFLKYLHDFLEIGQLNRVTLQMIKEILKIQDYKQHTKMIDMAKGQLKGYCISHISPISASGRSFVIRTITHFE